MASFVEAFVFLLKRILNENKGDDHNEEALDNFQRLGNFIEVQDVKGAYESVYRSISQVASSSIPSSWTLPGHNPPWQSPRDMTIDQLYAQAERTKYPFFRLLQALDEQQRQVLNNVKMGLWS
jgi:hypothetical protein